MSSTLELIGAVAPVALPSSPEDFSLHTGDDLRHAYREYAKHNDARLIFSHPMHEFSQQGQEALFSACQAPVLTKQKPRDDSTGEDDFFAFTMQKPDCDSTWDDEFFAFTDAFQEAALDQFVDEDEYWTRLKQQIDAFVATPHGRVVAKNLNRQLSDYLMSTMFFEGTVPGDLYERVVVAELCWREQAKANHQVAHPHWYEPLFEIDIVAAVQFAEDGADGMMTDAEDWTATADDVDDFDANVWSNIDRLLVASQKQRIRVPIAYTFEQFKQLLTNHTIIHDAESTDIWYMENDAQLDHISQRFTAITESGYPNFRKLMCMWPLDKKKAVLWHPAQVDEAMSGGMGWLDPLMLEREVKDDVKRALDMEFDEAEQMVAAARETGRNVQVLEMRIKPTKQVLGTPQHSPRYRDPRSSCDI